MTDTAPARIGSGDRGAAADFPNALPSRIVILAFRLHQPATGDADAALPEPPAPPSPTVRMIRTRRALWRTSLALAAALALPGALPAQGKLTTPKEFFGHDIGADYMLPNYTKLHEYFIRIANESDRVILDTIGLTEEGRPQIMAIVTSPANHRNLARYKDISKRLAQAEGVDSAAARALAKEGKIVYWIDGGLHATEVLGAQQLIETFWTLASGQDDEIKRILDDCIILVAHANPDGMELVSNWYMKEPDRLRRTTGTIPRLYEKYAGHDNNRDSYMNALKETTNMSRQLFIEWNPQIMHNHHQTGPTGTVMAAPPYRDPANYAFHPAIITGLDLVGAALNHRFVMENKPGLTFRAGSNYSTWWNGGLRTTVYFHNMIGILTETIGNPTPMRVVAGAGTSGALGRAAAADRAAGMEVPPVGRLLRVGEPRAPRPRVALPRAVPVRPLEDGQGRDRQGQQDSWTISPKRVDAMVAQITKDRAAAPAGGAAEAGRGGGRGAGRWQSGQRGRQRSLHGVAQEAGRSRSARVHPEQRAERLPDGDEVHAGAAEVRRDRASRDGQLQHERQELSGRLVGRDDEPGVPLARASTCSSRRIIRMTSVIRVARRSRRTTTPDGRSPTRWACSSIVRSMR